MVLMERCHSVKMEAGLNLTEFPTLSRVTVNRNVVTVPDFARAS
jgi:hypothetical protein